MSALTANIVARGGGGGGGGMCGGTGVWLAGKRGRSASALYVKGGVCVGFEPGTRGRQVRRV